MRRAPNHAGILACSRGGGFIEYVLLIGAMVLIAIGGYKLFGKKVDATISGEAEQVTTLDESEGQGEHAAPAAQGTSVHVAEGEKVAAVESGGAKKGASGARRGDDDDTSVTATEKMTASAKAETTVVATDGSAVLSNEKRADTDDFGIDFGWLVVIAGGLVLGFVLFKGKKQAQADAGAEKK